MHTDEAVHGVLLGRLLDGDSYRYNPQEYHGPTLYYLTLPLSRAAGEHSGAELTACTLRLLPALLGSALILLLIPWRTTLGPCATAWAALFIAISPLQLYYSRYFIHETLLTCFAFALLTCLLRYAQTRGARWALAAGICAGLMHATKETSTLMFVAMAAAALATGLLMRTTARPPRGPLLKHLALGLAAAAIVSMGFYSALFTCPEGIADSLTSLLHFAGRAAGQGHEKPWFTYLHWIGWNRSGGFVWTEVFLVLSALAAVLFSSRWKTDPGQPPTVEHPAPRTVIHFLALYVLVLAGLYSAIPYKTPWLMLAPMQTVCLLAGIGAAALTGLPRTLLPRLAVIGLLLAGTAHLAVQACRAAYRYSSDERMPYVYAHTSPDAVRLCGRIMRAVGLLEASERLVQVAAKEYWPLPWYLRSLGCVGYWPEPPHPLDAPVIVLDADYSAAAEATLALTHVAQTAGLRPGVLLVAWFRRDIWETLITQ